MTPIRVLSFALLAGTAPVLSACDDGGSQRASAQPALAEVQGDAQSPTAATPTDSVLIEHRALNDWYRVGSVSPSVAQTPEELETAARSLCIGLAVCRAGLWLDSVELPEALPVSGDLLGQQLLSFGRVQSGKETVQWNCDLFPQFEDAGSCLPRQIQGPASAPLQRQMFDA